MHKFSVETNKTFPKRLIISLGSDIIVSGIANFNPLRLGDSENLIYHFIDLNCQELKTTEH